MNSKELPKSVRDFIRAYLDSAEQLEILCLLRSRRDVEWTPRAVAKELRTNLASTSKRIEGLSVSGFLLRRATADETFYKYAPGGHLAARAEEFFQYHPTYRLKVYEAIFSPGIDSVKAFSESFKFRAGDDE